MYGSTINPVSSGTTLCFGPPASPPHFPGSCFPRYGRLERTSGPNKFGGTARMLVKFQANVIFPYYTVVSSLLLPTANLTGPCSDAGDYGIVGTININSGASVLQFQETIAPFTTGPVRAYAPYLASTGSFNFNATNLTGMISVVRPILTHTFRRDGGVYDGAAGFLTTRVERVTLTFLPEPGQRLMLALGLLCLLLGAKRSVRRASGFRPGSGQRPEN